MIFFEKYKSMKRKMQRDNKWIVQNHIDKVDELLQSNPEDLELFGQNEYGYFVNASIYAIAAKRSEEEKDIIEYHIKCQEKYFKDLTDLSLDFITFPNKYGLYGNANKDGIIPVTAYRMGYYAYQVLKHMDKSHKTPIIMEIGGGWGALAYILTQHFNDNCLYIILDIPTTMMLSSYALYGYGKNVYVMDGNEPINWDECLEKKGIVFIPPYLLISVPDKYCDVVINTASLAEMPIDTIKRYLNEVNRITKGFFYSDNHPFHKGGEYLKTHMDKLLPDLSLTMKQLTPMTAFTPRYLKTHKGSRNFVERIYQRLN